MNAIYLGKFHSKLDVEKEFSIKLPTDVEILIAAYCCERYEGDAFILFKQNNKLYEVNASHCSCYGLENQWEPEEVTTKELRFVVKNGTKFRYFFDCNQRGKGLNGEVLEVLNNLDVELFGI